MAQQFKLPSSITKKDLIEKYNELLETYQAKADELSRAKRQKTHAQHQEEKTVLDRVKGASSDSVTQGIAELKLQLSRSLNELAEKLSDKAGQLTDLDRAIALQQQRLSELEDAEIVTDSLEKLMIAYHERKAEAEHEFSTRLREQSETFETQKQAHQKELEQLQAELAEEKTRIQKVREREEAEYQYNRDRQRKLDQDAYDEKKQAQEARLKVQRESADRELSQREQTVAEREATADALQKQVDDFEARLEQSVAQARTEAAESVRQELTRQIELLKAEHKWEKKLADQRIAHLDQTITSLETKISTLSQELASAQKQVQDLANKAIEGASFTKAFDSVNKIALEQATGRTDKKGAS